jgi:hypothetical protein
MTIPATLTFPTPWVVAFFLFLYACAFLASRWGRAGRASATADGFHAGRADYEREIRDLDAAVCWRDEKTGGLCVRFPAGVSDADVERWAAQFGSPDLLARQERALAALLAGKGPTLPVH